jgi:hypothetical protein
LIVKPGCRDIRHKLLITGDELRDLQRHALTITEAFGLDRKIDSVDLVVFDAQGHHDADRHDRYASFTEARDAALTCIEIMLDEADYEDEIHRSELETMQGLLEAVTTFEDLAAQAGYRWFLERLEPALSAAA